MRTKTLVAAGLRLCAFAGYVSLLSDCGSSARLPSDAEMRQIFAKHEGDLVRLVSMSEEDKHVTRIAPGFTYLDTDGRWPRENIGLSRTRWNEYRTLFRKTGALEGISRSETSPSAVYFMIKGIGSALEGSEKGFVFSREPLRPTVEALDSMPKSLFDANGNAVGFVPLKTNWYIYRQED